jgi:phage terminase small subunit
VKPLSERERRFVEAYMGPCAGNATKAAESAGYSPKTARQIASRLLTKANIRAAVNEARADLTTEAIADAKERRELLTKHARNMQEPVSSIKAVDVLNKMDGIYIEKHDVTGNLTVEHRGAAERFAGSLAGIAARTAKRLARGTE